MLKAILFNDPEKFDFNDDNNLMDVITDNCIIFCEDIRVKDFLMSQIKDICEGKYMYKNECIYDVGDDEKPHPILTCILNHRNTSYLTIDQQQNIIFTIDPLFALYMLSHEDIWFATRTNDNKISIYPIRVFKGYLEDGYREDICKNIINGRYGRIGEQYNKPLKWEYDFGYEYNDD